MVTSIIKIKIYKGATMGTYMQKKIYPYLLLVILLTTACCLTPKRQSIIGNDHQEYGVVEGLFQHRCWNYYQRGISFADGALTYMNAPEDLVKAMDIFKIAENDLIDAISLRYTDQLRARTYGMHFVDYFPHREKGVINYYKAQIYHKSNQIQKAIDCIKNAINEIEISLYSKPLTLYFHQNKTPEYSAKTEKAIIYLQKARSLFNMLTKPDTPVDCYAMSNKGNQSSLKNSIDIWRINSEHMTYLDKILFEGRIIHNREIHSIQLSINEKTNVLPVSGTDIHFFKMIPLTTGRNTITITCSDSANHKFSAQRTVQKQLMHFPQNGNQLKLRINPFIKEKNVLVNDLEKYLKKNILKKPRFIALDSNDQNLFDCHLNGRVNLRKYSLEIAVELHIIENLSLISITSYIEGMNDQPENLMNTITSSINAKLANSWPVLSGQVEDFINDKVIVSMKYYQQARKGMKVLFFDKEVTPESMLINRPMESSGTIVSIINSKVAIACDDKQSLKNGMQLITR